MNGIDLLYRLLQFHKVELDEFRLQVNSAFEVGGPVSKINIK